MSTRNRLDEGFELLRACSREQAPVDLDLEDRMMREFSGANKKSIPRFIKVAAAALLCVVVAGAAAGATGRLGRILNVIFDGSGGPLTIEVDDGTVFDAQGNVIGDAEIEIGTD